MIHEHHSYKPRDLRDCEDFDPMEFDYDPRLAIHNALEDLRYALKHKHSFSVSELMLLTAAQHLVEGIDDAR